MWRFDSILSHVWPYVYCECAETATNYSRYLLHSSPNSDTVWTQADTDIGLDNHDFLDSSAIWWHLLACWPSLLV